MSIRKQGLVPRRIMTGALFNFLIAATYYLQGHVLVGEEDIKNASVQLERDRTRNTRSDPNISPGDPNVVKCHPGDAT